MGFIPGIATSYGWFFLEGGGIRGMGKKQFLKRCIPKSNITDGLEKLFVERCMPKYDITGGLPVSVAQVPALS